MKEDHNICQRRTVINVDDDGSDNKNDDYRNH